MTDYQAKADTMLEDHDEECEELAADLSRFRGVDSIADQASIERLFSPGLAKEISLYAEQQQLDPRGFLLPILTTISSVVGNRAVVAAEPGNDWTEPAILWGINLAPASGGKSPTAKPATEDALVPWQIREREKHAAALARWKNDKAEAEEGGAEAISVFLSTNPQPEQRHLLTNDATFEKLETMLAGGSTPGLLALHDEMGRWFSQLCRSQQQNDRAKWLGLYPGSAIITDRIGREGVLVHRPAVSIFGNLQPQRLEALWKADAAANDGQADGDGLWSRFLLVNLPDWSYRYRRSSRKLAPVLRTLYEQIDAAAAALPPGHDDRPPVVTLAPDALPLFVEWVDELEAMKRAAREPAAQQYLGKQRGNTLRLALALHAARQAGNGFGLDTLISRQDLEGGILLTLLFFAERQKALALVAGGRSGAIKRLLDKGKEWRKEHGSAPVPARTVRNWGMPERNASIKAVRDWLRQVVTTPGCGAVEGQGSALVWLPPGDAQ